MANGFNNVMKNGEEKLLSFINQSIYGYVEYDVEGNITFANKSAMDLSGYRIEDNVNFKNIIIKEDLQKAMDDLSLVLKGQSDGTREYRLKRKDGTIVDIEVSTLLIKSSGMVDRFQSTVLDISRRKKFEKKIRESEEKYRRLFEYLQEGIIISAPDGTIEAVNPAGAEMLGYGESELIGKNAEIIYADPETRHVVLGMLNKKDYLKGYEMPLRKKDGTAIYAKGSATLHRDIHGNMKKVEGIFYDITEKKQYEKKLTESEENYRTLVETTRDMIFRGKDDGEIVFMNEAVRKKLGYTEAELKQLNPFQNVHPEDLEYITSAFNRLMKGQGIENAEIRYQVKDGTYIDIAINAEPLRDQHNEIEGFTGVARDITSFKKATRELQRSQSIAEAYMDATTDAALLIDIHGTIIDLNKEFARRFSKTTKELIGTIVFDLFPENVAERRREMVKRVIRTGKPYRVQDEREGMWNQSSIHPLFDEEGNISHLVIFTHEITDFKNMEKNLIETRNALEQKVLKRTAELEEVNTALRVLVKHKDADTQKMEERILFNMNELITPTLEEIKNTKISKKQKALLYIIQKNLDEITSQFISGIDRNYLTLTPTEIKIANLVKQGKTNKEIAEVYSLSSRTVESHRDSIREKIGIKNKKVNLRSFLVSNNT